MASKVNVKFVVILSSILLLVFAGVATTAYIVLTKSGEDYLHMGDEAMASQDYKLAEKYYSRAVNHDRQNMVYLTKWLEAMEHYAPDLRADYDKKFGELIGLHQAIANAGRTDLSLHLQNLQFQWEAVLKGIMNPISIVQTVSTTREFFAGSADQSWKTILRYRGLAQVRRMLMGEQLDEEEQAQAASDLEQAIEADPSDGESVAALARLDAIRSAAANNQGKTDEADTLARSAATRLDAFLADHPHDVHAQLAKALLELDPTIRKALGLPESFDREALGEQLRTIAADIRAMDPADVSIDLLQIFNRAEVAQTATRHYVPLTRSIVDGLVEAMPTNARMMNLQAELMASAGELAAAIDAFQQIVDMPNLPISLDGRWLLEARNGAIYRQMGLAYKLWETAATDEDRDAALAQMRRFSGELADRLPADAPRLVMAKAQVAYATGDRNEARRLAEQYARQTDYRQPESLWLLAQTAVQVKNWEDAKENLLRLIQLDRSDARAMLTLATVYSELGDVDKALAIYDALAELNPDNDFVVKNRNLLRARAGQGSSGDPVTDAIVEAGTIQQGSGLVPGDPQAAVARLERAVEELGMSGRLAAQLAAMQLELDEIDQAKATIQRGLAVAPDDELLARLKPILDADDPVRARLLIIDASPLNEMSKLLSKSKVYSVSGDTDQAIELLNEARAIDPDNAGVIELLFQLSLRTGKLDEAQTLAQRATELNLDAAEGLTYRSRLADARGDRDEALELMRQAAELAPDNVAVLQALGRLELAQGRTVDGLETYRGAMRLRGNDPRLVKDFVHQLLLLGRDDEALQVLRQAEPHIKGQRDLLEQRLSLEASVGDRQLALASRREILAREPHNKQNKAALADLLMDLAQWAEARTLIDELRAEDDSLNLAILDARWYARQGMIEQAKNAFTTYISGLFQSAPDEPKAAPYLAMGALLLEFGDTKGGMSAMETALRWDDQTQWVQKIRADWLMKLGQYEDAIKATKAIVDAGQDDDRNTFRKHLIRALAFLKRGDEAQAYVPAMDERQSLDPEVLIIESELAMSLDDSRKARELLDEAVRLFPSSPSVFERRAMLIIQQAEDTRSEQLLRDAIGDLDSAIELEPLAWRSYRLRGYVRLRLGEIDEGLADLRQAVLANDRNTELLKNVMTEMIRRGKSFDAVQLANAVIDRHPSDLRLLLDCGSVFASAQDWTRAHGYFEQAWSRTENAETGTLYVRSLTKRNPPRWAEANQVLNKLDETVAGNPALLMSRASVRLHLNRAAAAREDAADAARLLQSRREVAGTAAVHQALGAWFTEVLDTFTPEDVLAVLDLVEQTSGEEDKGALAVLRGRALVEMDGRREEGLALLNQIASSDPNDRVASMAIIAHFTALDQAGAYAEAASLLRGAVERFPDNWQMLNNLAYTLADKLDKPAEAIPYAERAVALAPTIPQLLDTLGFAQYRAGRLDDASASLVRGLELAGTSDVRTVIALHLAMVKVDQRDLVSARGYLDLVAESERAGSVLSDKNKRERDALVEKINSLG